MRLLTTLFVSAALSIQAIFSAEQKFQDTQAAAKLARQIVKDTGLGTIITTVDESVSSEFQGHPFAIMEYFSDECHDNGDLLLFMSDLQLSARNMKKDSSKISFTIRALKDYNPYFGNHSTPVQQPRFTLLGEIEKIPDSKKSMASECFFTTHKEARPWQRFHDFGFYEFKVKGIYYVGGFGGYNYIGWLPLELYQKAIPETTNKEEQPRFKYIPL